MLRCVALVRTDVSEKLSASFIRVTRFSELGTTLTVTSNRRTQRIYILGLNLQPPIDLQQYVEMSISLIAEDDVESMIWGYHSNCCWNVYLLVITPCSPLKTRSKMSLPSSGSKKKPSKKQAELVPASRWYLSLHVFRLWRRRRYVLSKLLLTLKRLQDFTRLYITEYRHLDLVITYIILTGFVVTIPV
jgi:hypothetical protein